MDKDMQALQREALIRVGDIISDVMASLAVAHKELTDKLFNEPETVLARFFKPEDNSLCCWVSKPCERHQYPKPYSTQG